MNEAATLLAEALERTGESLLMVVTGAGVSLASGIPTFRGTDPEAVWKRDVTELGTIDYFLREPASAWSWYLSRFSGLDQSRPNAAHDALVALERWQTDRGGEFLLLTQNIDCLHEEAGSQRLIKVHGSSDRVRCIRSGCANGAPSGSLPRADFDFGCIEPSSPPEDLPRCPLCASLVRPHVLWFDEYYHSHDDYRFHEAQAAALRMATLLFVGTSFSVGVTELYLRAALARSVPAFAIDPAGNRGQPLPWIHFFALPAERLLPEVAALLGASATPPEPDP